MDIKVIFFSDQHYSMVYSQLAKVAVNTTLLEQTKPDGLRDSTKMKN
jgi:hypothetical protein